MFSNLPSFHQKAFLRRGLLTVSAIALLATTTPMASARTVAKHRHPRLHALAHAFFNATLPGVGLIPVSDDDFPSDGQKYELKLAHAHTDEMIDVVYRIGDVYVPEALDKLNQFLRDNHNQEISNYDPHTFDVLHTVLAKLGKANSAIDVLSGYRSQETNDELRASGTTNAAEHSQHIEAKAVDIRVPGVPAASVRSAALSLEAGGVGYYPSSQFVHVDTGPVRQWTFAPHVARAARGKRHRRGKRA